MPFGLTIGTERATVLERAIQFELGRRGYDAEKDSVMAEYITIMVINNKTEAQITSELEDLIGAEYDASFTDWLFAEAAKEATNIDAPISTQPPIIESAASDPGPSRDVPPHLSNDSLHKPQVPKNGIYQKALSQAIPSTSSSQKRTSSARSPSPNQSNKSRRTDLPTGPRAMFRDGNSAPTGNAHPNTRSLLDRVGGPANTIRHNRSTNFQRDDIQTRIDSIVNSSPDPSMMMAAGYPGMGPMDMNAMAAANIGNPLMLQEMMMNQMALMAQMASSMGIINPANGQIGGQGYPMQNIMPGDMNMYQHQDAMNNGYHNHQMGGPPNALNGTRGRGGSRGGRNAGRGRAIGNVGTKMADVQGSALNTAPPFSDATAVAAPIPETPNLSTPAHPVEALAPGHSELQHIPYALLERPQSPTLCKFSTKCTNMHCRYSHPSPVATAESGVVLSNESCEAGKNCKDQDCVKAHVSPAVLNPPALEQPLPISMTHVPIQCRFGPACTRLNCTFTHPPRPSQINQSTQQCRFGASCTRAACTYQHPEGRVLPTTFHRGLSNSAPLVNVPTPEAGSMIGRQSRNMSMTFSKKGAGVEMRLEKQMKELEQTKKDLQNAEAAAHGDKSSVAIPA